MFGKEPTAVINGISELVRQVIPMLIIFGLIRWTDLQVAAAFAVLSAFLALVQTLLTRSQVVPVETVNAQIKQAVKMSEDTTVKEVVAATAAKE